MSAAELSIVFFLQLFVIIAACRVVGWLANKYLMQPQVVGEMIAGVVLGPTLLGYFLPSVQGALFPADSKSVLFVGAQLGVGLYMFLVGLEFRRDHFRENAKSAMSVSIAGMAAPFAIAILMAPWLLTMPGLFAPTITRTEASLFLGAAIAITAFPMLARIIKERGLSGTKLGTLSLAAGAIDDAAAWSVLAIVLASFGAGMGVAIKAIAGGLVFVAFIIFIAPRLFAPLGRMAEEAGEVTTSVMAMTLMAFMLAAFAMDAVGLHAVFGGFLLGTAMPRGLFVEDLRKKLEPFTVIVLLPIFFTFSGLHTQLQVIGDPSMLLVALAILAASIFAKGGACWAVARLTGQDNATALGIGALMNARGLMELIIINIGLQRGIIGVELFSMLVLMAIVTTMMASPFFELVNRKRATAPQAVPDPAE